MWARTVEFMLGCWLMLSPFIFRHPADHSALWANDMACGAAVIVISLVSHGSLSRYLHLATAGVALWLFFFGYFYRPYPTPPPLQNDILAGLLLLIFAVIPNQAALPPRSWRYAPSEKVLLYPEPPALSERQARKTTHDGKAIDDLPKNEASPRERRFWHSRCGSQRHYRGKEI